MEVKCANCGAKIPLKVDVPFLSCPFCASTLYLDRSHTFNHYLLKPSISKTRALDLLKEELEKRELSRLPVLETRGKLLPFWRKRGGESLETIPAFPPPHPALEGYHLPPSGAELYDEAPEGFEEVACSESSSAHWESGGDTNAFSLFHIPFYEITTGSHRVRYTIWIDAVSGRLFLDQAPPSLTGKISSRFWGALVVLFLLFFGEAIVLPGVWAFVAVVVTAAGVFPLLANFFEGGG